MALHVLEESKKQNQQVHIPSIIKQGDGILHEGDDNAYVNCQTKDGKGTWHVLARSLYRNRLMNCTQPEITRIKRGKAKSLKLTPEIVELTKPVPYETSSRHHAPPRIETAIEKG